MIFKHDIKILENVSANNKKKNPKALESLTIIGTIIGALVLLYILSIGFV